MPKSNIFIFWQWPAGHISVCLLFVLIVTYPDIEVKCEDLDNWGKPGCSLKLGRRRQELMMDKQNPAQIWRECLS